MKRRIVLVLTVLGLSSIIAGFNIHSVRAVIWIEGHITSDTTWTPVDTYRVINNTYVDPGVTLTIGPGVRVEFADGFSLIVEGSLNAEGTDANPIIFTSSRSSPTPGAWNTINFQGTPTEQFLLKHVKIEYAVHGVTIKSLGSATIEKKCEIRNCSESGVHTVGRSNLVIRDSEFALSRVGIFSEADGEFSGITIQNNEVSAGWNGIYVHTHGRAEVHNITIENNNVRAGENGIYIYTASSQPDANVYNLTIQKNEIEAEHNGIYVCTYSTWSAIVCNITIQDNEVSAGWNGICTSTDAGAYWREVEVHNITIENNNVRAGENGIYIFGHTIHGHGVNVHNIVIQNNTVISCVKAGLLVEVNPYIATSSHDVSITNNTFSANKEEGIQILYVRTYIGLNSIFYNLYGIRYARTTGNLAESNDICSNSLYGMHVSEDAKVKAERNYWGHPDGPSHPSHPEGKGNPVNGDLTDLDFIPYLSSPVGPINKRPVAVLEVDKTTPIFNETVTFDATGSTDDDGRIDYYLFDFGDGTNSSWTSLPVVVHKYAEEGVYNATLVVMDDFGVTSLDGNLVYVTITVVPEFPSMLILPLFMLATLLAVVLYRRKHPM